MVLGVRVCTLEGMSPTAPTWNQSLLLGLAGVMAAGRLVAADMAPEAIDRPRYELEAMTAVLWKVGGGATPLTYLLLPQIISLRIPPINVRPLAGGTLVFRSRFSLLLEPIVRGPEHFFIGTAAVGELEWWHATNRFSCFFGAGGGFGWMDSEGHEVAGGQGQDFNFDWMAHAGMRYRTREGWQWSLGAYFQHISNRGMNKINPGLNAVGPSLGLSRRF